MAIFRIWTDPEMNMPANSPRNLRHGNFEMLQVVRCFAALVVVWHHTEAGPRFGIFGVDLFFVLSGCVMAMLMSELPTPGGFMAKRIVRVAPLYFICTATLWIGQEIFPGIRRAGLDSGFTDFIKSVCFIPYINTRGEALPILSVGWTLNFEMVFYACCAGSLWAFPVRAWALSAALAALLVVAGFLVEGSAPMRFWGNPIIFEFISGLLVWEFWSRHFRRPKLGAPHVILGVVAAFAVLAIAETGLASGVDSDIKLWIRPAAFLPAAVFAIYVSLCYSPCAPFARNQLWRSLVRIGDAGYAIYLTHMFIVAGFFKLAAYSPLKDGPQTLVAVLTVVASACVGVFVHEKIDMPMQTYFRRRIQP